MKKFTITGEKSAVPELVNGGEVEELEKQIPSNYISIPHQSEGIRSTFGTAVRGMMAFGCLLSSICSAAPPTDTQELFEHYCFNCHDEDEKKGDLDLSAFLDKSDFDGN